jgi:iron complex transport system ATP-binding protein
MGNAGTRFPAERDVMVEVNNAGFSYNGTDRVFEGIGFSVKEGEILSILGPNGSGKTTLLKCLNALFRIERGEIRVGGERIDRLSKRQIGRRIGYIPQSEGAMFPYTVREMVLMGRCAHIGLLSSPSAADVATAERAIETLSISHLIDRPYTNLSGGEAQLVLIARALAAEPSVLLLDEPTSHLDFRNQVIILDVLDRLARDGRITTIMTTHFPDHALSVSDTALLLGSGIGQGGGFLAGSTEEVITEDNLNDVFGVEIRIVSFEENGIGIRTVVPLRRSGSRAPSEQETIPIA